MNKTSIKVIKRKSAQAATHIAAQDSYQPKQSAVFSREKIERRVRRKIAQTVSGWIAERKEKKRSNEISAIRKLFGDESLLSKTA